MTLKEYHIKFTEKAKNAGYSEENIQKCLVYAEKLIINNVPVIYNTSNFAAFVGYEKNYIKRAALHTKYFYRSFKIKKKNGKLREIKEPLPSLKELQLWILEHILNKIPVSKFAKAYIVNRGIVDNVRFHKNKDVILCLDLADFFTSISINKIEVIFQNLGYSPIISNLLSKMCCNEGVLPQGAPTSPSLSNIYMRNFDEKVAKFCVKNDLRYTRYADDLTFSFPKSFDAEIIKGFVCQELSKLDLSINKNKTRRLLPSDRQIVTGVIVNNTTLRVPREVKKEIRQEVYYIKKFGLASHLQRTANLKTNYIEHLLGKINYALFINKNDSELADYKDYVKSLMAI